MKQIFTLFLFCSLMSFCQQENSLSFDGNDDNITLNHFERPGTMTIEAWVKINNNSGDQTIIGWGGNNNNYTAEFRITNDGRLLYGEWNGSTFLNIKGGNINYNIWYHVAIVRNGNSTNNVTIYIDGILEATGTVNHTITTNFLNIGAYALNTGNATGFLKGNIDELRIWNVARTSTEISNNMSNELSLPQTGLLNYYKFNQGVANGNNSTETTFNDELNANNGTLLNFALGGTNSNWVNGPVLSLLNISSLKKISIYPNPSSEFIHISNLKSKEFYRIYNALATEIKNGYISDNKSISIRDFTNGLYFLTFDNGNTIKFIKE